MWNRIWTFLGLVWGEWSSRVTGSISAVLVLLGLFLSIASEVGPNVPASPFLQLGTWVLAIACGGIAAYTVWAKEYARRVALENRLRPRIKLRYDPTIASCRAIPTLFGIAPNQTKGVAFRIQVENVGEETIYGAEARLVEVHQIGQPSELGPMLMVWVGDTPSVDLIKGVPTFAGLINILETNRWIVASAQGWSNAHVNMFDQPGEYIFRIVVSGRNVSPAEYAVKLTLTGNWQTAKMEPL